MRLRNIALVVLGILVLIVASQGLFVVNEYDQVVVVQFGEPVRTVKEPGLHLKIPFIQEVLRFEKRIMTADGSPDEWITSDGKRLVVDFITRWRIADPLRFYQRVRTESGALQRLYDIVGSRLRQEVNSHPFTEILSEQREPIIEAVTAAAYPVALEFGIEIIDVRIKRADLPSETQQSVFDRMTAERQAVAAGYRAEGDERALEIRSEADKERDLILAAAYEEAQTIRGEGEALAMQIYAQAYSQDPEFFAFMRSLQVYESILNEDTTLVLSADSPLFQFLESPY